MNVGYKKIAGIAAFSAIVLFFSSCGSFKAKSGHNPALSMAKDAYKEAISVGALKYAKEEITDAHKLLVRGQKKIELSQPREGNLLFRLSEELSIEAKKLTLKNKGQKYKAPKHNFKFAKAKVKILTGKELKYERLLALRGVIGHIVLNPFNEYTNKPVEYVSGYSIPGSVIRIYGAESDVWTIANEQTGKFEAEVPLAPNKLNQLKAYALNTNLDPASANIFQNSTLPSPPHTYKNFSLTGYSVQPITGVSIADSRIIFKDRFGSTLKNTGKKGAFNRKLPLQTDTANEITVTALDKAGNLGWPTQYVVFQMGSPPAFVLEESRQYIGITPIYQYIFDSPYIKDLQATYGISRFSLNPYGAVADYTWKPSHIFGIDLSGSFGYTKSGFSYNGNNGTHKMMILSGIITPEYHKLINRFDIHLGPGVGVYYLVQHTNYPTIAPSDRYFSAITYNLSAQVGINYLLFSNVALSTLYRISWGKIANINKHGESLNPGGMYIGVGFVYYLL